MRPNPPAAVTAAASRPPATMAIGASRIGCSILRKLVRRVFSVMIGSPPLLNTYPSRQWRQTGPNQVQACGHQLAEIVGAPVTAPTFNRHNKSRRQCGTRDLGHQIDVR